MIHALQNLDVVQPKAPMSAHTLNIALIKRKYFYLLLSL